MTAPATLLGTAAMGFLAAPAGAVIEAPDAKLGGGIGDSGAVSAAV